MLKSLLLVIVVFSSSVAMCGDKALGKKSYLLQLCSDVLGGCGEVSYSAQRKISRLYNLFGNKGPKCSAIQKLKCPICMDLIRGEALVLNCRHMFHAKCLKRKFQQDIKELKACLNCPVHKCEHLLNRKELLSVGLSEEEKNEFFKIHLLATRNIKLCKCGGDGTIHSRENFWKNTCRSCGEFSCFWCHENHEEKVCEAILEARKNLIENKSLDLEDVKFCPDCFVAIQKSEGCSKMICGGHAHFGPPSLGSGGCGRRLDWETDALTREHALRALLAINNGEEMDVYQYSRMVAEAPFQGRVEGVNLGFIRVRKEILQGLSFYFFVAVLFPFIGSMATR